MKLIVNLPDIAELIAHADEYEHAVNYRLDTVRRLLGNHYGHQHVTVMIDDSPELCNDKHPDYINRCYLHKGHRGPHHNKQFGWDNPQGLRCGHLGPREATSTCVLSQGHSGEHTDEANGTWPQ